MNDRAIKTILSTLERYEQAPGNWWPKYEADEYTFSKWATEESLNLIWDHPWTLASDTIAAFAIKLEVYATTARTEEQERIFSIAAETVWELLEDVQAVED